MLNIPALDAADVALPHASCGRNLFLREVLLGSGLRDTVFQHTFALLCEALQEYTRKRYYFPDVQLLK
jgi:hypothetical protein